MPSRFKFLIFLVALSAILYVSITIAVAKPSSWKSVGTLAWNGSTLKIKVSAQHLKAGRKYYGKVYCDSDLIASKSFKSTSAKYSTTISVSQSKVDKYCSPLPHSAKIKLGFYSDGVWQSRDSATKTIPVYETSDDDSDDADDTSGKPKVFLALSSNTGHGWNAWWDNTLYEDWVITPLKKKLGSNLITCHHECTPQNMKNLISQHNPKLFVWMGGGLSDHMECDGSSGIGSESVSCGSEIGLSGRVNFINMEFATEFYQGISGAKASLGYWTEMSNGLHSDSYDCDYFKGEKQPLNWYAPYFILMRGVIEDLVDCRTVADAAKRADAKWEGFLSWVSSNNPPEASDYQALSGLWLNSVQNIQGDSSATLCTK